MIHHIEENSIREELVKNSDKVVLINFFADWCVPSQMLTPVLAEIDKKYPDVEIYKINVDEAPNTTITYGINSVPTTMFFKDGEEVERKVGLESIQKISQVIDSLE